MDFPGPAENAPKRGPPQAIPHSIIAAANRGEVVLDINAKKYEGPPPAPPKSGSFPENSGLGQVERGAAGGQKPISSKPIMFQSFLGKDNPQSMIGDTHNPIPAPMGARSLTDADTFLLAKPETVVYGAGLRIKPAINRTTMKPPHNP